MSDQEWSFFLKEEPPKDSVFIVGLPDVGLVGPISTSHLVKQWELREIGYLDSASLPPVILFHEYSPLFPIRFYGGYKKNDYVVVLHSDIAIPPELVPSMASFLTESLFRKSARRVVLLGGIAVQNRLNIETPKTYAASIDAESLRYAQEKGIELLKEGFIGGAYAQFLKEGYKRKLSVIALLAECFLNYPDPGASASALQALAKILGHDVDVKQLLEQEEEIRVKLRELMKRTMESMRGAGKEYEYTVPALYV
ncbi:proteasome assembly chaperone family protein [Thermofilum pendens]|uniref:Proteasome assembly chaperone family protein n=1 Tax=Thermofilum pendens (strain DSM 2475 / Hrk 5) TaxID=368408 RepID=A1RY96_THEPD|nr:PAC2 family protein [Thermofilum pendens]ABL78176.1 protein of unknown function DUF75 [Thermofilum pendens Hrk 5]